MQMATSLNKYSFRCIHMLTPFCIKTNLRENRFFAAKWTVGGKKGTHNVKFSTENLTKIIILHARASGQRHRKDVRLQQPARAVVGDVAHDQPRLHHGKAEVICYRQVVFQLVENVWNILPPSRLLKHNHVLPQTNGAVFQVFIVSPSSTLCMSRMFISVLPHKENKLHPTFIEPLKVKTTSMSWWKLFVSQLQTRLYTHYKRLVVSVQAAL